MFVSEMNLPPPVLHDQTDDGHDASLDSINDSFDFDINVDENHFSLSTNDPTDLVGTFFCSINC